jgi:hypothetical protein
MALKGIDRIGAGPIMLIAGHILPIILNYGTDIMDELVYSK